MPYSLTFDHLIKYDTGQTGIPVEVTLLADHLETTITAKIDTGASHCIFERKYGEALGFSIETGVRLQFGTATGTFIAFGHSVTLSIFNEVFDVMVFFAMDENFNKNVLGRRGWLDLIQLSILDYEGKLYLSRYSL